MLLKQSDAEAMGAVLVDPGSEAISPGTVKLQQSLF
jgi:hypothetical protein